MIALLNSRIYFTHAGDLSKLYTFIAKEGKESEANLSVSVSLDTVGTHHACLDFIFFDCVTCFLDPVPFYALL